MISRFGPPPICVIDDDEAEFRPITTALSRSFVGWLHVRGDGSSQLPTTPIQGFRLVFTDLHLSSDSSSKTVVSHTANVFLKMVSPETAPIIVVIWSKFASDKVPIEDLPEDDQPTLSEAFQKELLQAEPRFNGRLIFVDMPKPQPDQRPELEEWIIDLQKKFNDTLNSLDAVDALLAWESIVKASVENLNHEITNLAFSLNGGAGSPEIPLNERLKKLFQILTKEQGGPGCSQETAPKHLTTVLAQSLADQLEHSVFQARLSSHGEWLSIHSQLSAELSSFPFELNGWLLTSQASPADGKFLPGTVYHINDLEKAKEFFGSSWDRKAFKLQETDSFPDWWPQTKKVLIEISPACDFHQSKRSQAFFIAALVAPIAFEKKIKNCGDAFHILPAKISLRWPAPNFPEQVVSVLLCANYKVVLSLDGEYPWLSPWFRFRDLPTAAIRSWQASHSSRIGFVSIAEK